MGLVLAFTLEHGLDLTLQEVVVLLQVVVLGKDGHLHLAEVVLVCSDIGESGAVIAAGVGVAA
jgi:hypothetical protein